MDEPRTMLGCGIKLEEENAALKAERDALRAENAKAWADANEAAQIAFRERIAHNETKTENAALNDAAEISHVLLQKYKAELAAAQKRIADLEAVEWVGAGSWLVCPWCKNIEPDGHRPDCVRRK